MENTNKGIKKYVKLEDGRVLESSKVTIIDRIINGILYHYVEEWNDEGTYTNFTKVVGDSDYLHKFYDASDDKLPGLEVVVYKPKGNFNKYDCYYTSFDFDEYYGCCVDDECDRCPIEDGEEVLLGSWYKGGMCFVAKWDREKKDWVLIYE